MMPPGKLPRILGSRRRNAGGSGPTTTPSRSGLNIPMNKVTKMRKFLEAFERSNKDEVLLEESDKTSQQRAKIQERMNKVSDLKNFLCQFERENKTQSSSTKDKKRELNIPINKVKELQSWLYKVDRMNKSNKEKLTSKGIPKNAPPVVMMRKMHRTALRTIFGQSIAGLYNKGGDPPRGRRQRIIVLRQEGQFCNAPEKRVCIETLAPRIRTKK